jgi:hypothetical protein
LGFLARALGVVTLVVNVERNWFIQTETELSEDMKDPKALLARIREGIVFGFCA